MTMAEAPSMPAEQNPGGESGSEPVCSEHNQVQTVFCITHDIALCTECVEGSHHKDCKTSPLEHEVCNQLVELLKIVSTAKSVKDEMTEKEHQIQQDRAELLAKYKENIQNAFDRMAKMMIDEVEKIHAEEVRVSTEEQDTSGKLTQDAESALQQLTDVQHKPDDKTVECMQKAKYVKTNLERCTLNLAKISDKNYLIRNMNINLTKKLNEVVWPLNISKFILLEEEESEGAKYVTVGCAGNVDPNHSSLSPFSSFELVSILESMGKPGSGSFKGSSSTSSSGKSGSFKEETEMKETDKNKGTETVAQETTQSNARTEAMALSDTRASEIVTPIGPNFKHRLDGYRQSDSYHCWFTGVQFLHDDRLVLVDRNNDKLKLFSLMPHTFVDSIPVPPKPFDIVQLKNGELAVSVPDKNRVHFYDAKEHFIDIKQSIDTLQPCYGLAVHNEDLLVYCDFKFPNLSCIKVFDKHKRCKDRIVPHDFGRFINMVNRRYIAVDQRNGNIYFAMPGFGADEVYCIDSYGKVLWRTSTRHWSHFQEGIAAIDDDAFLTSPSAHHIARLSHCGHEWKTTWTLTDYIFPTAISINKDKTKVAVTSVAPLFTVEENDMVYFYNI